MWLQGIVIAAVATATIGSAGPGASGPPHDREFWRGIAAREFAVPEGEDPMALMRELSAMLASRDPEERDALAYEIPARWIYVQRIFTPEQLREIRSLWIGNLKVGIGESGNDSVLLRSFSVLDLSILAALDNEAPYLTKDEFQELLGAALAYFRDERDVRGWLTEVGWLHSVAHTADLLKFLGRSRHLDPAGQARILAAIAAKLDAPGGIVYTHGEDERMARAVLSLAHRKDLDRPVIEAWLSTLAAAGKGLWDGPLDPGRFAAVHNTKNFLKSLHVLLSLDAEEEGGPAAAGALRSRVLEALSGL